MSRRADHRRPQSRVLAAEIDQLVVGAIFDDRSTAAHVPPRGCVEGLASYRVASGFGSMTGSTAGCALPATAGAMVTFLGIAGVIAGGVAIVICTGVRKAYPATSGA